MLKDMAMRLQPAWAVHLRPGSSIPIEDEAARKYLRRGNLPEALLRGGPQPALVAGDLTLSHDQLRAAAEAAAGRLRTLGASRGRVVALIAANCADWIISYLGLQLVGAMVVVGSPNSSNTQRLKEVAERAGCARAALVPRADDINWALFEGLQSLGVTAGASAPEVLVEEVIGAFDQRYAVTVETVTTADEDMFFPLPRVLRGNEAAE